jgi:hypothetical protein
MELKRGWTMRKATRVAVLVGVAVVGGLVLGDASAAQRRTMYTAIAPAKNAIFRVIDGTLPVELMDLRVE